MTTQDKKELSEALVEALAKEDLHTGEAAGLLNLNPAYISMIKNEKLWDAVPAKGWSRTMEWFNARCAIRDFVIPEGEEIFKRPKKEDAPKAAVKEPLSINSEIASPAARDRNDGGKKAKKQKNGKSVILQINNQEMADLRQKIAFLEEEKKAYFDSVNALSERIAATEQRLQDTESKILNDVDKTVSILNKRLVALENIKSMPSVVPTKKHGIIVFQRNIFQR